jgi:hypothetical protein
MPHVIGKLRALEAELALVELLLEHLEFDQTTREGLEYSKDDLQRQLMKLTLIYPERSWSNSENILQSEGG